MRQFLLTVALALGSAALAQTEPAQTEPAQTQPAQPAPAQTTPAPTTTPPASATPTTPAADPSTTVATVGGQTLTLGQFDAFFQQLVGRTVNAQGVPLSPDVLATFGQYRPQLLDQFARQQAVLQIAAAAGIKPDQAKIDKTVADARSGFGSDAEFASALQASGFASPDAFRASVQDGALYQAYLDSLKNRFQFGDAVVGGYYQLNKAKFTQAAQACVKHILVGSQAEAQDIVKKLGSGSAFADLAKASSKDPGSAAQGGDLGCLAPGETVAPFDKAAFTGPLNTPQVVQSEFGWHVLVVSSRTPAGLQPLASVQDKIRDQLSSDAAQKYLDSQINRLRIDTVPAAVTVAQTAAPAPGTPAPGSAQPGTSQPSTDQPGTDPANTTPPSTDPATPTGK